MVLLACGTISMLWKEKISPLCDSVRCFFCIFQSWQKRIDMNIFLWPWTLISFFFLHTSAGNVTSTYLAAQWSSVGPLVLVTAWSFSICYTRSHLYWAKYSFVLSWIALRFSTLARGLVASFFVNSRFFTFSSTGLFPEIYTCFSYFTIV